jgi:hypothetical protein
MGTLPISVRSSATNEACITPGSEGSVHAGENKSFMLPNNHPDFPVRLEQLRLAIFHIYNDFIEKQSSNQNEKMAIVINPIPGIMDNSAVGTIYYPLVSGVANSYFPYALKIQDANNGFARIAFGHGYATVLDDFPVISMATIKNPLPVKLLGQGQSYFYAIDMTKNKDLQGSELETMKKLHVRFASPVYSRELGLQRNQFTFESLIQKNALHFKTGLNEIMGKISTEITGHFQIEFIFNIRHDEKRQSNEGFFHIVQLTTLPQLTFEDITIPDKMSRTYLSTSNLQGHGIKSNIEYAVVVSPFIYTRDMHKSVSGKISQINTQMQRSRSDYILVVPGRLGSTNRDWGIQVDYRDVDHAAAIFEYGVDIAGRPEPVINEQDLTGGIYGSHFLYMIQGGDNEEQKQLKTRIYGTQGTHFLTNLMSNNVVYGYIRPDQDFLDPWFFTPKDSNDALYILTFPNPVTIYADSINQRCIIGY